MSALTSKRITLDFPNVPPAFVERVARVVNMWIHEAEDLYGSLAVATITPLEPEPQAAQETEMENDHEQ